MALKNYSYRDSTYQFDDNDVPEGAVLVKQVSPKNKQGKPADKGQGKPDTKESVETTGEEQGKPADTK